MLGRNFIYIHSIGNIPPRGLVAPAFPLSGHGMSHPCTSMDGKLRFAGKPCQDKTDKNFIKSTKRAPGVGSSAGSFAPHRQAVSSPYLLTAHRSWRTNRAGWRGRVIITTSQATNNKNLVFQPISRPACSFGRPKRSRAEGPRPGHTPLKRTPPARAWCRRGRCRRHR